MKNGAEVVLKVENIGKRYEIYDAPHHRLLQTLLRGRKQFFKEFWALRGISFEANRGECIGIIGSNGSGKSTLLQIIAGTLAPTIGSVKVQGSVAALLELGSGFNPECTGRENVYMNGAILGFSKAEMDEKIDDIAAFADIGDFFDRPVKIYSSGMMIRLAFSVSIQVNPEILIVDEALSVGDVFFQSKCYSKIEELKSKNTVILLASHDMNSIRSFCDKSLCLDDGRIVAYGKSEKVVEMYFKNKVLKSGGFELDTERNDHVANVGPVSGVMADTGSLQSTPVQEGDMGGNDTVATNNFQYGNGKAELVKYTVNGVVRCKEARVKSNGVLEVETVYAIHKEIQNPVFGLVLKTPIGIELYGNNTTYAKKALSPLLPGQTIKVRFTQTLHLNNGPYLLTLTIAEWVNHQVIYIDRRVDFILLNVEGGPIPHMGFCNFAGVVEVKNVSAHKPFLGVIKGDEERTGTDGQCK